MPFRLPCAMSISIPALREEGDDGRFARINAQNISIPALREEGDFSPCAEKTGCRRFLSPPSARRATSYAPYRQNSVEFLSPPSARRATSAVNRRRSSNVISIPALREEGDVARCLPRAQRMISIPALREEGDTTIAGIGTAWADFYPRPPRGGRPPFIRGFVVPVQFLSPPSARRATFAGFPKRMHCSPFLSPPSARRATFADVQAAGRDLFLSPPSARRATWTLATQPPRSSNFYPRPPRGGRHHIILRRIRRFLISIPALREEGDPIFLTRKPHFAISIPALREEGDAAGLAVGGDLIDFYPRPPRGGRPSPEEKEVHECVFLSPPSARRATKSMVIVDGSRSYFYPRPPRGGRRNRAGRTAPPQDFYPRPPRGGRLLRAKDLIADQIFLSPPSARRATWCRFSCRSSRWTFLSPPSARRATRSSTFHTNWRTISIPALREEGDKGQDHGRQHFGDFYPRPPRGGRLLTKRLQSIETGISIPALREEGDYPHHRSASKAAYFYPRPPRGGRPLDSWHYGDNYKISIPALREEGDSKNRDKISIFKQIIQHSARI